MDHILQMLISEQAKTLVTIQKLQSEITQLKSFQEVLISEINPNLSTSSSNQIRQQTPLISQHSQSHPHNLSSSGAILGGSQRSTLGGLGGLGGHGTPLKLPLHQRSNFMEPAFSQFLFNQNFANNHAASTNNLFNFGATTTTNSTHFPNQNYHHSSSRDNLRDIRDNLSNFHLNNNINMVTSDYNSNSSNNINDNPLYSLLDLIELKLKNINNSNSSSSVIVSNSELGRLDNITGFNNEDAKDSEDPGGGRGGVVEGKGEEKGKRRNSSSISNNITTDKNSSSVNVTDFKLFLREILRENNITELKRQVILGYVKLKKLERKLTVERNEGSKIPPPVSDHFIKKEDKLRKLAHLNSSNEKISSSSSSDYLIATKVKSMENLGGGRGGERRIFSTESTRNLFKNCERISESLPIAEEKFNKPISTSKNNNNCSSNGENRSNIKEREVGEDFINSDNIKLEFSKDKGRGGIKEEPISDKIKSAEKIKEIKISKIPVLIKVKRNATFKKK